MEIVVRIEGWKWEERVYGDYSNYPFWTTKDSSGKVWIVKFTGSFYSYREWVFSRLASRLGLNVRDVRLVWISEQDLLKTDRIDSEPFQLVLEHIDVHDHGLESCNINCPYPEYKRHYEKGNDFCKYALSANFNAVDRILKDFLAYIFGANEPSECLFGADHKLYIIDNEQMFQTEPRGRISVPWLNDRNGAYSESGHKILKNLCRKIVSLSDADLLYISKCPDEYSVDMIWDILPILRNGKNVALSILKNGS